MTRILAVTRKPESASFEHRVRRWIEPLATRGIDVAVATLPQATLAQHRLVGSLDDYDAVWWHRHLLMPMLVGRLRRHAQRLVFDFDDPLPISSRGGGKPSIARRLRFARLLSHCDMALPASHYLADLARPYCDRLQVVPMAIEPPQLPPEHPPAADATIELLWLGSLVTQPYLAHIGPALAAVGRRRRDIRLRLVAHEPMRFGDLPVDFHPWSHDEQESALRQCHIGLCPMPDTPWTRGKCPFKVLQYMAYALPWIGSAVGENVISAGDPADPQARGCCCPADPEAWADAICQLADDPARRHALGQAGRAYIDQHHSRTVIADRLAHALQPPPNVTQ